LFKIKTKNKILYKMEMKTATMGANNAKGNEKKVTKEADDGT
jgi:hypothetical protein